MKTLFRTFFTKKNKSGKLLPATCYLQAESGSSLTELLLAVALAAAMFPFLIRMESDRTMRARDIHAAAEMNTVRDALSKYITARRAEFGNVIGQKIYRVRMGELSKYGLNTTEIADADEYQMRVIKTADRDGNAFLQGIVARPNGDLSPLRTRAVAQIANAGYADSGVVRGVYDTWNSRVNIWRANFADGALVSQTGTTPVQNDFIKRVPTADASDATMGADLDMGGHSVMDINKINVGSIDFSEFLNAATLSADSATIKNTPTLDGDFTITNANVAGTLSSDSRNIETPILTLSGTARVASVDTKTMRVGDLTASGVSVYTSDDNVIPTMNVNQGIEITNGTLSTEILIIGFDGSVTPQLSVYSGVSDPTNPNYVWNVANGVGNMRDIAVPGLPNMLRNAIKGEAGTHKTSAENTMSPVATNNNATIGDFVRAINEIKSTVTTKYQMLNLE